MTDASVVVTDTPVPMTPASVMDDGSVGSDDV
jgi:hypothetical protein